MTIIVSVKINDGIVMASDSASTFQSGQTYLHADKIVNLVKGVPIGVMVTGNGGIGSESIATLLKDLRSRLDGTANHEWKLDRAKYTIQHVAELVRKFLFEEKAAAADQDMWMQLRICGYSAGRSLPEIWEVVLQGRDCAAPKLVQPEEGFGVNWDGEYEALDRLVLGVGSGIQAAAAELGVPQDQLPQVTNRVTKHTAKPFALPAMPIQDAIDLARFLVETTAGFVRFSILNQPKTVGGAVEIAVITKHEGFRWVQRRHFYNSALNP